MAYKWQELKEITQGKAFTVERVKFKDKEISVEGSFELPPLVELLVELKMEDLVFVITFIKNHGSIKKTEKSFGISYPTVKKRLDEIAEKLQIGEIVPDGKKKAPGGKKKAGKKGG